MSTRASIVIKDDRTTLYFYRHSDGYPEGGAGDDLTEFVQDYKTGALRDNVDQSAGWLIVRGHFEYKSAEPKDEFMAQPDRTGPRPDLKDRFQGWKVGAYEPTSGMHGDEEYIYIIDLSKKELTCRVPKTGFWDNPCIENTKSYSKFKKVSFKAVSRE